MTAVALPALALIGAVLLALGFAPQRREVTLAAGILCTVGAIMALGVLLASAPAAMIEIPVGLPGLSTTIAFDGLAAFFAFLVFATGAVLSLVGQCGPVAGAVVLTLMAGDTFALAFGVMAVALTCALIVRKAGGDVRAGGSAYAFGAVGASFGGAICLVAALSLAGPWQFGAIRLHAPDGWRAAAILMLTLLGAGSLVALTSDAVKRAAVPPAFGALLAGAVPSLAIYIVARVAFDLLGPGQPIGLGIILLILGSVAAVLGATRACLAPDLQRALAAAVGAQIGFTLTGFGLAWIARGADLTGLAALALGGALLSETARALGAVLLSLCGRAVEQGAGTRAFARLGGLIQQMPVTSAATLAGLASLAALPPTAGFAALWTLLQVIVGMPPVGDFGMAIVIGVVAALLALASALLATAALRLFGVAFLGRPRSPRAAAAVEVARSWRYAMLALAGLLAGVGVFPATLIALARPALGILLPAHASESARLLSISAANGSIAYSASGVAILLALGAGLAVVTLRRGVQGHVAEPTWDGGFAPPPAWMPFGDPATQISATSFAPSVPASVRRFASTRLPWAGAIKRLSAGMPPLTSRGVAVAGCVGVAAILIAVSSALAFR